MLTLIFKCPKILVQTKLISHIAYKEFTFQAPDDQSITSSIIVYIVIFIYSCNSNRNRNSYQKSEEIRK